MTTSGSLIVTLIGVSDGKGKLIIRNKTDLDVNNWQIKLTLFNFQFKKLSNLNFVQDDDTTYIILPKHWQTTIHAKTSITTDFFYEGSNEFHYKYEDISKPKEKGIYITIDNNTDTNLTIASGASLTFSI